MNKRKNITRFILYLARWQMSTPILAPVMLFFPTNFWIGAMVANFIGACIFFFVDRMIFTSKELDVQWEKRTDNCWDCGKYGRVYRIVKAPGYDKWKDKVPEYRCGDCADKKAKEIL